MRPGVSIDIKNIIQNNMYCFLTEWALLSEPVVAGIENTYMTTLYGPADGL